MKSKHTGGRTQRRARHTARRTFGSAGKPASASDTRLRRGTSTKRVWKDGRWTTARTRTAKPPTRRARKRS